VPARGRGILRGSSRLRVSGTEMRVSRDARLSVSPKEPPDGRRRSLERARRWTERRARSSEKRSLSIQNVRRSLETDRFCVERITLSREGPTFSLETVRPSRHPASLCFESAPLDVASAQQGGERSSVRGSLSVESGARSLVCDARSRQRRSETRPSGSLWIESDPKCRSRRRFSLLRSSESSLRGQGVCSA
jgi:hypothetical protein